MTPSRAAGLSPNVAAASRYGAPAPRLPVIGRRRSVIEHIRFDTGFFSDKIFVVPKRAALLEAIPGDHKGELKLKVSKRYRDAAMQFVTDVLGRKRAQRTA